MSNDNELAAESTPAGSTISVKTQVVVEPSAWAGAISKATTTPDDEPPAKRRRLKESPPTEEPERILLIRREITFAFEDEESYSLLFGGLDGEQPTIKFEVDWGLRRFTAGVGRGPIYQRRFTLYHENRQLFSFVFDIRDLSSAAWLDIDGAWTIMHGIKKATLKEYHQEASFVLVRDPNNRWSGSFKTEVSVVAANEWSARFIELSNHHTYKCWQLLARGLPVGQPHSRQQQVAPREFYLAAHVPEKREQVPACIQPKNLMCDLLPFQRRAVKWMLKREGVEFAPDASGGLVPVKDRLGPGVPPTFFEQQDKNGDTCYVSHVFGIASKNLEKLRELSNKDDINGGILAEEMGLGKTVELISLLCLHQREGMVGKTVYDPYVDREVKASPATLIITPPSILQQWQNEIAMHAPGLKVFHYEGIKKAKDLDKLTKELLSHDVVLTTYKVLSAEVHFVQPPPSRNMRHAQVYIPPRTPLVDIQWWRVCLDEAQMVESVISKAASVAREIPRVNAWCVTGTPVRKDVDDLYGLLMFLRYEPFCNKQVWNNMVRYNHDAFRSVFGFIALRHSKDRVREELYLPQQNRVVVTVPFSQVEEEIYRQQFTQMCTDCKVDSLGAPLHEDWTLKNYAEKMRGWLTQLRQTCVHPEAGERNKKAFGQKGGPLRTVEEVLVVMIEQHMVQMRTDERTLYQSIIKRGQVHETNGDIEEAMIAWQEALELVKASVAECRNALAEEIKLAEGSKEDPKGKAKTTDEYEESDDEDNQPEKKYQRVGAARNRLRSYLEIEHACYFWLGTGYFQLREKEEEKGKEKKSKGKKDGDKGPEGPEGPDQEKIAEYEAKETEYYELAKQLRREMMQETRKKALAHISEFQRKKERQAFVLVPDIIPPEEGTGGIESQTILDAIRELANVLNQQVIMFDEFREKLVGLLLEPLVDGEEEKELAGNEIEVSVEKQEESYAYMSVIRALLADRGQALTGGINSLIQRDMETAFARPSKIHSVLFRKLMGLKDKVNPVLAGHSSLRLLMNSLKGLITNLKQEEERGSQRARLERGIAEREFNKLQKMQAAQTKCIQDCFKEVELFRNATNSRMEFYRQLQDISDTLLPIDVEKEFGFKSINPALFRKIAQQEAALRKKINDAKARGRYLTQLSEKKVSERPTCLICLDVYESGIIAGCGHSFCKDCIQQWRKHSQACPVCKAHLKTVDFFQITYNPKDIAMQKESQSSTPESTVPNSPGSSKIYADVDGQVLNEIKAIELDGASYGSKIDMMTRHLLWLKENEPGFKAVVFSQWSDVLDTIMDSLKRAGIGFATLQKPNDLERFKHDPDTSCFLLHAKSQSAGLTLVNATHVFLCEPLLNVGLELQAISRVHRIGQEKDTTVWLYAVNNTVEQSVMELAARRRMAIIGRKDEEATMADIKDELEAAESDELRQGLAVFLEKAAGGGEKVQDEDLWGCLFSKAKEHELEAQKSAAVKKELMASAAERRAEVSNVAGPSGDVMMN